METVEILIKLPKELYKDANILIVKDFPILKKAIAEGIPLPKNHGKVVDLGKIDEDRIEQDNPVMTINICGTAIEAIPLDYLYSLPDLIKKEVSE